jgi:hypothetical protein
MADRIDSNLQFAVKLWPILALLDDGLSDKLRFLR